MNSRIKRRINIEEIEKYFLIEEDGAIWSLRKKKYLRPTFNTSGYLYVLLPVPTPEYETDMLARSYAIHRLVACKYIGQCPDGKETSHKDGNKQNNHYTNLEYITHSQNILKSYREHGRIFPVYERKPVSDRTKELMSNAKKKRVLFIQGKTKTIFDSIKDASQSLSTYRKKIYRCITENKPFKDKNNPNLTGKLSFILEKQP